MGAWKMVDDVDVSVDMRETRMWLSGRTIESHFPSGENWTSRAPEEKDSESVILETLSPSSSALERSWKTLISAVVATARRLASAVRVADVMLASPLTKILATSLRPLTAGFSSSSSLVGTAVLLTLQTCTSLSHQLRISLFLGELPTVISWGRKGNDRWFSNPNCPRGVTMGEASGPISVSQIGLAMV